MPPSPLITKSPRIMSGTPVFTGTRVPVEALFDYFGAGKSLDVFLDDFPSVSRDHAVAVIDQAGDWIRERANETAA